MIYSNSGNLLMPLVASAMGQEWLFYTCAYMGALQIFVWTHGESLICGAPRVNFKKALGNLNVLAMAAGFVLFCANIRFTGVAGEAVETLGNALGSTSMLSIGISFATITRLDLRRIARVAVVTLNRLVLYPLLMLGIFLLLRLDTLDRVFRSCSSPCWEPAPPPAWWSRRSPSSTTGMPTRPASSAW